MKKFVIDKGIFSSSLRKSLSKRNSPKPGPARFSLVIISLICLIDSTCSSKNSPSIKSQARANQAKIGSLFSQVPKRPPKPPIQTPIHLFPAWLLLSKQLGHLSYSGTSSASQHAPSLHLMNF
ncbi:hypothetical protein BpHYR1_010684 [Brachionus plicatilis]|uniref:Uncharacterized protein n=1 Tax=Brachionus plicatilis TaxID=10195 RepID=A0A3M7SVI5_BRAPC|nr:hypothetical protein BpHYR1_010684 [Brachionus plicatilis]